MGMIRNVYRRHLQAKSLRNTGLILDRYDMVKEGIIVLGVLEKDRDGYYFFKPYGDAFPEQLKRADDVVAQLTGSFRLIDGVPDLRSYGCLRHA